MGLTSCLPYGLPEGPANYETQPDKPNFIRKNPLKKDKSILLIAPDAPQNTEYFGSQFLLFFPITRLYLQHGIQSFVLEKSVEVYKDLGFEVFITNRNSSFSSIQNLNPTYVVEPRLENLKINVKDYFVIRKIKIEGSLLLQAFRYQKSSNVIIASSVYRKNIDNNYYKRFGKGPFLTFLLEKELKTNILNLSQLVSTYSAKQKPSFLSKNLVLINQPQINENIIKSQGPILANSYGFNSEKPYNKTQIGRLVQNGTFLAFNELKISVAQNLQGDFFNSNQDSKLTLLDIYLEELIFKSEKISLKAKIKLWESKGNGHRELLFARNCSLSEDLTKSKDGKHPVSLENSLKKLTLDFFQKTDSPRYCFSENEIK